MDSDKFSEKYASGEARTDRVLTKIIAVLTVLRDHPQTLAFLIGVLVALGLIALVILT